MAGEMPNGLDSRVPSEPWRLGDTALDQDGELWTWNGKEWAEYPEPEGPPPVMRPRRRTGAAGDLGPPVRKRS